MRRRIGSGWWYLFPLVSRKAHLTLFVSGTHVSGCCFIAISSISYLASALQIVIRLQVVIHCWKGIDDFFALKPWFFTIVSLLTLLSRDAIRDFVQGGCSVSV